MDNGGRVQAACRWGSRDLRQRPAAGVLALLAVALLSISQLVAGGPIPPSADRPAPARLAAPLAAPELPVQVLLPRATLAPLASPKPRPSPTPDNGPCGFMAGFAALAAESARRSLAAASAASAPTRRPGCTASGPRGELVWFRDSGITSFTDGAATWYRCSAGIERRPSA